MFENRFDRPVLGRDVAQVRVAEDVAQALGDLVPDARRPGPGRPRRIAGVPLRLALADPEDEPAGRDEAERVEQDRERRAEQADQSAAERLAEDLGGRAADLELRVALDQVVRLEDRRQERLVGDVEEDGQGAVDEADDEQLPDRQHPELVGDRDRQERDRSAEVAEDEDQAPRQAIDPRAGREREQQERQELDRPQQGDLVRRRIQQEDGDDRDRDEADLRPEQRDRRRRPQLAVVGRSASRLRRGAAKRDLARDGWHVSLPSNIG